MRRLLLWFRAHRIVTWTLRVVLVLWALQLWMNWAAEREWRQYCDEARKRGVKLTLAEFARPEIPDAENFAMLPMFKGLPVNSWGYFQLPTSSSGALLPKDEPITGKFIDWKEWPQAFKRAGWIAETSNDPVADVLRGFDRFAPQINEWREWKQRSRCRFPFDAQATIEVRTEPYNTLQWATQLFGWRMRVHLAQGDSSAALEDFRDSFQSYRALQEEPGILAGWSRLSVFGIVNERVAVGLALHAWAEPELRLVEAELAGVRMLDDYRLAMTTERALGMDWMNQWVEANPARRAEMFAQAHGMPSVDWVLVGFGSSCSRHKLRENQLRQSRYVDELLARVSDDGLRLDLDRAAPLGNGTKTSFPKQWHYVLFNVAAGGYESCESAHVRAQTNLHQLRLAIALERFHLAHGVFPEALDQLVPEYLPEIPFDPWSGKAMKYRGSKADSYVLYSVGRDRQDDGGTIDPKKPYPQRDQIWRYAPP